VRDTRQRYEAELADLRRAVSSEKEKIARSTKPDQIVAAKSRLSDLQAAQTEVWNVLSSLPTYDNALIARWQMHLRRKDVERRLIGALARGELSYWLPGGTPEDKDIWLNRRGRHYDLELSTVWFRLEQWGRRREFVRIYRASFDAWLDKTLPARPEDMPLLERAKLWFERFKADHFGQIVKRDDCLNAMCMAIPDLSRNAAQTQIWDRFAPSEWRKPGKRRTGNR
jgi:hypothetical protein